MIEAFEEKQPGDRDREFREQATRMLSAMFEDWPKCERCHTEISFSQMRFSGYEDRIRNQFVIRLRIDCHGQIWKGECDYDSYERPEKGTSRFPAAIFDAQGAPYNVDVRQTMAKKTPVVLDCQMFPPSVVVSRAITLRDE